MLLSLLLTGVLLSLQPTADPSLEAERLARAGEHREALRRFQDLAATHPDDLDARVWIGRLQLWLGHVDRAESAFRGVLVSNPAHVEALVGLAGALLRLDRPEEALEAAHRANAVAPENADVLATLARVQRVLGHTATALALYDRAAALAPANADIQTARESLRLVAGHRVEATGFSETFSQPLPVARSGDVAVSFRLDDRWRLGARAQRQQKFSRTETRVGVIAEWRMTPSLTWSSQCLFGGDVVVLPQRDVTLEGAYAYRRYETSGLLRYVRFAEATVAVASPGLTVWIGDNWAVSGWYYLSLTQFSGRSGRTAAHSAAVRTERRVFRRVWAEAGYARGIENFETLSADRLGRFRADTVSGGLRVTLPSLTTVTGVYEYQWRTTANCMGRATVVIAQRF